MNIYEIKHPLRLVEAKVLENSVMILERVSQFAAHGETHTSANLTVCLIHRGSMNIEYDMEFSTFSEHEVVVVLPNHTLTVIDTSDDFIATLLIISPQFLKRLDQQLPIFNYAGHQYSTQSRLNDKQFAAMVTYFEMLGHISRLHQACREDLLTAQIEIGIRMWNTFMHENSIATSKLMLNKQPLITRFYNAIVEHYRESHEVQFYANLLCLSPKYFGTIIRETTNINAGEWIARYIVTQAKTLLRQRRDLSIQQISTHLGFSEQTSFTRYFRNNTGQTPKEYRTRN